MAAAGMNRVGKTDVSRITAELVAPELRPALAKMPRVPVRSAFVRGLAALLLKLRPAHRLPGVSLQVRGAAPRLRLYRPETVRSRGALLWIHGGGYVIGSAAIDDDLCSEVARELGILVVSADYRLAPRHPFPAPLDDCHAVWLWMLANASGLGIDPARIVIGGMSAGGGLAATLVQRVCDEAGPAPAGQLLFAPMLDDRTAARKELDALAHPVWDNGLNRFGWASYLESEPGETKVPLYAAAARKDDLSELPPAWIGVGSIELFHDEDVAYAKRLQAAGTAVTLEVVPGAPHGFEAWGRDTAISRRHQAKAVQWLGERIG
jgi:acetyl esterase/lipase